MTAFEELGDSSNREEWLRARSLGIGASEMAAVMGESRFDSAISVYARKVGAFAGEEDEQSEAAYWGSRLERIVAEEFSRRTGLAHLWHGRLIRSVEHPWALCTLDAVAGTGDHSKPLECKTANQYLLEDWSEGAPLAYQIQAQQQMLVTGEPSCFVACLIGGQRFVWTEVERDPTLIRKIIYHGEQFWQRVQDGTPPDPDGSDASFRALNALYPEHAGAVELSDDFEDLDDERLSLKEQKTALEKRLKELDARLMAAIGDREIGTTPSGVAFRLKKVKRCAYTVAESEYTLIQRKDPKTGKAA